jgi:hypothetical protein
MITEKIKRFWRKYLSRGNVFHFVVGRLLNALKIPGFVGPGNYLCPDGTTVAIRFDKLCTVVTVNNLDVYFRRLTGTFDGVAHPPPSTHKEVSAPSPILAAAQLE